MTTLITRTASVLLVLASTSIAQVSVELTPSKDNTLYRSTTGNLSNGAGSYLFCGRTSTGGIRRALVAFDVAGAIPAGSTIQGVTLRLGVSKTTSPTGFYALHRVENDWGEGTSVAPGNQGSGGTAVTGDSTWIHRFYSTVFWQSPGGDYVSLASAGRTVSGMGPYTWMSTAQLVGDVQSWLDQPAGNHGWILIGPEGVQSSRRFYSREHPTVSFRPTLKVTFLPPQARVQSVGVGCAGAGRNPLLLSAQGLPSLGNGQFSFNIAYGYPGGTLVHILSRTLAAPPLPLSGQCSFYLAPSGILSTGLTPLSMTGGAAVPFPIPGGPHLLGVEVHFQVVAIDSGLNGLMTSNALTLRLGK